MNSMNCMVRLGSMSVGGSFWYCSPLTHRMSGLNLELQWHLCVPHVQGSSQFGNGVFLGCVIEGAGVHESVASRFF